MSVADGRLLVWCYPAIAFTDRDLLPRTLTTKDGAEFGMHATGAAGDGVEAVVGRRADARRLQVVEVAARQGLRAARAADGRVDEAAREEGAAVDQELLGFGHGRRAARRREAAAEHLVLVIG